MRMKRMLIVFTLLHPIYFFGVMYFPDNSMVFNYIFGISVIFFYFHHIISIWNISVLDRTDKIRETLLTLLFGVFAMWAWIQFNDISKKTSPAHNRT